MRHSNPVSSVMALIVALSAMLFAHTALSAKAEIYSHKSKGAVKGADVVAYFDLRSDDKAVKGSDEFTHEYKGSTFKFANNINRTKFIKNPEAYIPQYGGYCAFAVSKGFLTSIRPNSWKIVEGKLYLNHNASSFRLWEEDQANKIKMGDANWPGVLTKKK